MKICRRMGETKQIVQVNGGNILLFELAFRLLTLPLLLQAVAALFRLSVRASGYSYVTVSNLVFLPAAAGYDRDSGFDGSDPTGGSFPSRRRDFWRHIRRRHSRGK